MRLACRLGELRQARGLSLAELVAELPKKANGQPTIHRGDLSRLERGRMLPRDEWVPLLEAAYGAESSTWYVPPPGAIAGVVIESDSTFASRAQANSE